MSTVSSRPQKPQIKAPKPKPAAVRNPKPTPRTSSPTGDRFTPSAETSAPKSVNKADFLSAAYGASKPEATQTSDDSRELLFSKDNPRFESLAKAERELKQLKDGNHPGTG